MRHTLAVLATILSLVAVDAHAQRYAVISLIGDRMQLAFARGVDGQPVDRIERRYIPLEDSALDRAVLLAANERIKALKPGSEPVLVQAFERTLFDANAGTAEIIEWIRQLAKGKNVTHAIIVSKLQYNGIPALQKAYVGSGTLEGVGFFVGREPPAAGADANSGGPGFLSPYAYFTATLVELGSGRVLREEKGLASTMLSATATDSGNAWETLTAQQKVKTLTDLVRAEIGTVMPKLLN